MWVFVGASTCSSTLYSQSTPLQLKIRQVHACPNNSFRKNVWYMVLHDRTFFWCPCWFGIYNRPSFRSDWRKWCMQTQLVLNLNHSKSLVFWSRIKLFSSGKYVFPSLLSESLVRIQLILQWAAAALQPWGRSLQQPGKKKKIFVCLRVIDRCV